MRVTIAGAGIGGLTLAAHLAEHDVVVLERRPRPMGIGAGLLLHDEALGALRQGGVELTGRPFHRFDLGLANGRLLPGVRRTGLAIRRPDLHEALLQATRAEVRGGTTVRSFTERSDHVQVTTSAGDTLEVDVLVGADGLGSTTRQQLGAPGRRRYSGATCWRGLTSVECPTDQPVELWGDGTRVGLIPLVGGTYLYLTSTEPEGSDRPTPPIERFQHFAFEAPAMIDSVSRWSHHDLAELDLHHFGTARVPLLGDAAHGFTPNLGEGAAQAILDAAHLAQALRGASEYPGPRRGKNWRIATASRFVGHIGQASGPTAWLRDRVVTVIGAGTRWVSA